jgi:hypothetical protein
MSCILVLSEKSDFFLQNLLYFFVLTELSDVFCWAKNVALFVLTEPSDVFV